MYRLGNSVMGHKIRHLVYSQFSLHFCTNSPLSGRVWIIVKTNKDFIHAILLQAREFQFIYLNALLLFLWVKSCNLLLSMEGGPRSNVNFAGKFLPKSYLILDVATLPLKKWAKKWMNLP